MAGESTGNSFRASVLSGGQRTIVVDQKKRRGDKNAEGLASVMVARSEKRRGNHRNGDRHRLESEVASVRHNGAEHEVQLINLSGGGAMVSGPLEAQLWDRLELVLGEHGCIECIVRWKSADRFGLEFAHETRLDCDEETRDEMLRQVIRRSFADISGPLTPKPLPEPEAEEIIQKRADKRHPLIWNGVLHHDWEWESARIRNISANGAMIECIIKPEPGATVYLDIGEAGRVCAKVCWARGGQIGLAFEDSFDLALLAAKTPDIAPNEWSKPEYLRDASRDSSPWAAEWGRLTVTELRATLQP